MRQKARFTSKKKLLSYVSHTSSESSSYREFHNQFRAVAGSMVLHEFKF